MAFPRGVRGVMVVVVVVVVLGRSENFNSRFWSLVFSSVCTVEIHLESSPLPGYSPKRSRYPSTSPYLLRLELKVTSVLGRNNARRSVLMVPT